MKLRFSQIYAILTAIALCYLAVTGYAAEAAHTQACSEQPGGASKPIAALQQTT